MIGRRFLGEKGGAEVSPFLCIIDTSGRAQKGLSNGLLNDKITDSKHSAVDRQNPIQGCCHCAVGIAAVITACDINGLRLINGQAFGEGFDLELEGFSSIKDIIVNLL